MREDKSRAEFSCQSVTNFSLPSCVDDGPSMGDMLMHRS